MALNRRAKSAGRPITLAPTMFAIVALLLAFTACRDHGDKIPSDAGANATADDRWYVLLQNGKKLGYSVSAKRNGADSSNDGESIVEITSRSVLSARRGSETNQSEVIAVCAETRDGNVRQFTIEIRSNGESRQTQARVVGGQLEVVMPGGARKTLVWPAGALPPGGWEREFARRPLAPGQSRKCIVFDESQIALVEQTLTCVGTERIVLLSGPRELLRCNLRYVAGDGQPANETLWFDAERQLVKHRQEDHNLEQQLATRDMALAAPNDSQTVDLLAGTFIRVARPLAAGARTRAAHYRLRLPSGDPAAQLDSGPSQLVRRIDEHTADCFVRAVNPLTDLAATIPPIGKFPSEAQLPTEANRRPNTMLESDDPNVVALAAAAAREVTPGDSWSLAVALEKHVHKSVKSDFTQVFDSAAQVARSPRGDCSEHAVLLAAMLRARGIPSRLALGLVYVKSAQAFGYHVWTESWTGDRWTPLDATIGQGGAAADRIRIATTSLENGLADPAFLKVTRMLGGQPTIEIVESSE